MKPAWMKDAACRGINPNLMVPDKSDLAAIRIAKEVCRTCPVRDECREYGLEVHRQADLDGVFGGLSKIERLRILRKENLPRRRQTPMNNSYRIDDHLLKPCGTVSSYQRHVRRKEPPCNACRSAWAAQADEYRKRRQEKQAVA